MRNEIKVVALVAVIPKPEGVCHPFRNVFIVKIENSPCEKHTIKRFGGGGPKATPPPARGRKVSARMAVGRFNREETIEVS